MEYSAARRAEFDWLRVVALGLLVIFHSAMGFSSWPWHVTDPHHNALLDGFLDFLLRWRIGLVFIVSGAALMLALRKRGPLSILCERCQRLALPLVVGVLVIVPPQVYLERLQRDQFHGSYLEFLPHITDGIYPAGNLSWHHLWFFPYVLVLTVVLLPLFLWAHSSHGRHKLNPLIHTVADRHLYWLLAVPLALAQALLYAPGHDNHTFFTDGHGWIQFVVLFILGAVLAEWPSVLAAVQRNRYAALAVGLATYAALRAAWPEIGEDYSRLTSSEAVGWCILSALNVLTWVLAAIGFFSRWFNRGSSTLAYAAEAALPVYILHQTLIVFAVYHLHHVDWPLSVKMLLTLALAVIGSLALYEVFIRRSRWLRPMFGVKSRAGMSA